MIDEWVARAFGLAHWAEVKLLEVVTAGDSRFHWLYLLSFVVTAAAIYAGARAARGEFSLRGFIGFLFPKDIYLTRSARLDLELFFANRILSPVRVFLPFMSAAFVATYVASWLVSGLGDPAPVLPAAWWSIALFTIGLMAASDLGSYITHRIHHEIPMLWEFHKVHHSAEVLTPMTAHRMHPVYDIIDIIIRSGLTGALQGLFIYLTVGEVSVYTVLGANALLAIYYFCGSHLRHSHIWLSWGPIAERLFISPAQHQVHHSYLPHHLNKNYGDLFALWDWMFGSLYVTGGREEIQIGVGGEQPHANLWKAYAVPFVECHKMWRLGGLSALLSYKALDRVRDTPPPAKGEDAANDSRLSGAA